MPAQLLYYCISGEYPWQAAILQKDQYDNIYTCGAALIDRSHLLTATHCINKYRPEQLRVRLGEWDVHNDDEIYPNIEMDVLKINYHPNFHTGNLYNDLAVVTIDGSIDFEKNPHIAPVCLPDAFQVQRPYKIDLMNIQFKDNVFNFRIFPAGGVG